MCTFKVTRHATCGCIYSRNLIPWSTHLAANTNTHTKTNSEVKPRTQRCTTLKNVASIMSTAMTSFFPFVFPIPFYVAPDVHAIDFTPNTPATGSSKTSSETTTTSTSSRSRSTSKGTYNSKSTKSSNASKSSLFSKLGRFTKSSKSSRSFNSPNPSEVTKSPNSTIFTTEPQTPQQPATCPNYHLREADISKKHCCRHTKTFIKLYKKYNFYILSNNIRQIDLQKKKMIKDMEESIIRGMTDGMPAEEFWALPLSHGALVVLDELIARNEEIRTGRPVDRIERPRPENGEEEFWEDVEGEDEVEEYVMEAQWTDLDWEGDEEQDWEDDEEQYDEQNEDQDEDQDEEGNNQYVSFPAYQQNPNCNVWVHSRDSVQVDEDENFWVYPDESVQDGEQEQDEPEETGGDAEEWEFEREVDEELNVKSEDCLRGSDVEGGNDRYEESVEAEKGEWECEGEMDEEFDVKGDDGIQDYQGGNSTYEEGGEKKEEWTDGQIDEHIQGHASGGIKKRNGSLDLNKDYTLGSVGKRNEEFNRFGRGIMAKDVEKGGWREAGGQSDEKREFHEG